MAVINYLVFIPTALYSQLHCDPFDALWDPLRQTDCHAQQYVHVSYATGVVSALSDLILALLPTYILWSLQVDKKLKWALCFLLGLGIVAAIAAAIRTWASQFLASADVSCECLIVYFIISWA